MSQDETRRRFLERLTAEARRDGFNATFEESPSMPDPTFKPTLTELNIGAGTDPQTGLPVLHLDRLAELGFDAPDQRYLLSHEAAVRIGAALIAAADPELVAELILARIRQPRRPRSSQPTPGVAEGRVCGGCDGDGLRDRDNGSGSVVTVFCDDCDGRGGPDPSAVAEARRFSAAYARSLGVS